MTDEKKLTLKDKFALVKNIVATSNEDEDTKTMLDAFIAHEIEKLENKKSSAKMTDNQVANEGIKENIVNALAEIGKPVSIATLRTRAEFEVYTPQKLSSLMTLLVKAGKVTTSKDKKTTLFALVVED